MTTPEHTTTYRHNAFGNRVAKLVDGVVVEKYLWENKTRLLATFDGNNNLKHSYEYTVGNTPTSYYAGNQRYYILTDQLGSPRIITDSAGNVLREIEYDSYGNIIADSNPTHELPFGFAGGLYDQHTGLIRFGFRDYDPETGRWTARDPIGFAGGDTNLYGYVLGDPVNFIDPFGLIQASPNGNGVSPFNARSFGGTGGSCPSMGRSGAFKSAKEKGDIPRNQQPKEVYKEKIKDVKNEHVEGRVYKYDRQDGSEVLIKEHSRGHEKGNVPRHFNTEVRDSSGNTINIGDNHSYY